MSDFEYFELRYLEDIAKYVRDWVSKVNYQLRLFDVRKPISPIPFSYLYQYVKSIEEDSQGRVILRIIGG